MAEYAAPDHPTDVDDLLFAAIDVDAGMLPPEDAIELSHPDYVVLDTALNAIQTARNGEVAALHQQAARRLKLPVPRGAVGSGPGYVVTEQYPIDRVAIVEHISVVGPTVAGMVATAYALDPKQSEPIPSRLTIRAPRLPTGYQALQRIARQVITSGAQGVEQSNQLDLTLQPRLYGRAANQSRAYPRPQLNDTWAVGLFGAYTAAWVESHRSRGFLSVINRLERARHQALVDVYTRFERQSGRYPRAGRAAAHERIGKLSIQALGLRMGMLLERPYQPQQGRAAS